MAAVSSLRPDPHQPGAVLVEVDGRRFASLPVERVTALGLTEGAVLDAAGYGGLEAAAVEEAAYRAAVVALGRRSRAVGDLIRWLMRRGHTARAARAAADRLVQRGVLDDAEFARTFVRSRARKGHAPARLRRDLLALGVDRATAEAAIAETLEAEGVSPERELLRLAERRLAQLTHLPPPVRRRRLLAYLARRGHAGGEVRRVVGDLLSR